MESTGQSSWNSSFRSSEKPIVRVYTAVVLTSRSFSRPTDTDVLLWFVNYLESKRQVLANLANFAYDPVNYVHIRTQRVIDLFIEQLTSDDNKLIAFAAAGLCNLVNGNNCIILLFSFSTCIALNFPEN